MNDAPLLDQARIIVTVLTEQPPTQRVPPPALKNSVMFHDYNPGEPGMTDAEAEAALDRTVRQIAGDPDAFRH